jgi:hypothetical protein
MNNLKYLLIVFFSFGFLYLSGCESKPKQGQWYESIQTGKRYKLLHIFEASYELEQFNIRFTKELKEINSNSKPKHDKDLLYYLYLRKSLLDFQVKEKELLYYLDGYYELFGNTFITNAMTESKLKEDYRLVN